MWVLGSLYQSLYQGYCKRTQLLKQGYEAGDWSKRKNRVPNALALGQKQGQSGRQRQVTSVIQPKLFKLAPSFGVFLEQWCSLVESQGWMTFQSIWIYPLLGEGKIFSSTLLDSVPEPANCEEVTRQRSKSWASRHGKFGEGIYWVGQKIFFGFCNSQMNFLTNPVHGRCSSVHGIL